MSKSQRLQQVSRNSSVMVLSDDAVATALLLSLLELEGFSPLYPHRNETPARAVQRLRPRIAIVDCDHAAADNAAFYEAAAATGTVVLLFSTLPIGGEVAKAAARHGIRWFTLPIDRARLRRLLHDVLQDASEKPN